MKPVNREDGRWQVRIPRKLSGTGKRESRYFSSKSQAEKFIKEFKTERREHGKQAISSEERHWIQVVKTELGSLDKLRDVLDHWKRTGRGVQEMGAKEAADAFIKNQSAAGLNLKTVADIRWRIRAFGESFGSAPLHQITPGQIENYLRGFENEWSRRSFYKRLRPLFAYAKRHRWIAESPFDELDAPDTPRSPRRVYSPEEFKRLIDHSVYADPEIAMFIALSGLAFFRTRELVRQLKDEPVLEWRDILLDRELIHVREEVGKHTKRSSNERFVPLHPMLKRLFTFASGTEATREGRVVDVSMVVFRRRLSEVFKNARVEFIDNGLRKSAISYWLAAHPEFGVAQVSQWAGNSESSCRQHYLRILTQADGQKWFDAAK